MGDGDAIHAAAVGGFDGFLRIHAELDDVEQDLLELLASKRMVLKARVTDPPGFGNYIRYFTKVNRGEFLPGLNSVFDDALVNNSTYVVDVDKGVDRNTDIDFDNYGFFAKGDTVTIKFSNIDKATFDFWRTAEFSYQSIGNPFSTPTKIIGNISNGALGYFGGYANQFSTVYIPR